MIAASPMNISDVARLSFSAAVTPRKPPRMTTAVFTYSSGRTASFIHSAKPGMKLPMKSPTSSATTKPPSAVSFNDQPMPNFCMSPGVLTAKCAQLPMIQQQ
jgi:hypothetical protein